MPVVPVPGGHDWRSFAPGVLAASGVIRPARRPPEWVAPGPPPRPPADAYALGPRAGEDLCYLTGEWRIFQRIGGHRWSHDDLLTAWVARDACRTEAPARVVDLGCGIGAVLLMMAWSAPRARILGIEAQDVSVDLARRSILWNGVADRCDVRYGDLRDATIAPEGSVFDLVTGTPPYLPIGSASESRRAQWAPCHFEHRGGIVDYCAAAARLLARRGRFVVCAAARDGARVTAGATAAALAIMQRLDVIPRAGKPALFSVYVMCRRDDAPDNASGHASLTIRDAGGQRTAAYRGVRAEMGLPP